MAVDLMHDAELGFCKGIIFHALRLLAAEGGGVTKEFNARSVLVYNETFTALMMCSFWQAPTFGCGGIQKFGGSVSSMKKMTMRGFEDIIQVSHFVRHRH